MAEYPEIPATQFLITPLGGDRFRLTLGSERRYVVVTATGAQLEQWTGEIRVAIGARPLPARGQHPYAHLRGSGAEGTWCAAR